MVVAVFSVPLLPVRIAAQQLRDIVYGIKDDIHVAVVIEIPKGTPARRDRLEDRSAEFFRDVPEMSVPQIVIDNLWLAVADVKREPLDFGIDVAVGGENVQPTVVIEIEEAATPAEVARVHSEAGGLDSRGRSPKGTASAFFQ